MATNSHGLVDIAARIAIQAHWEQRRKSDKFPYIVHPFGVAIKLQRYGFRDEVVAAALLHDVIEDTSVTAEDLRTQVGEEVLGLVQAVSEDKGKQWRERKEEYIANVAGASDEVKAISVADKIYNLEDSLEGYAREGEAFWNNFTKGKDQQIWFFNEFLASLKGSWSHALLDEFETLVAKLPKV